MSYPRNDLVVLVEWNALPGRNYEKMTTAPAALVEERESVMDVLTRLKAKADLLTAAAATFRRVPIRDEMGVRVAIRGAAVTFSWEREDFVGRGKEKALRDVRLSAVLDDIAFAWSAGFFGTGSMMLGGCDVAIRGGDFSIARSADGVWRLTAAALPFAEAASYAATGFVVWTPLGFLEVDPALLPEPEDVEREEAVNASNVELLKAAAEVAGL